MKLSVIKESGTGEHRVAIAPDGVKKLQGIGIDTTIESGAGLEANFGDDAYTESGAKIDGAASAVISGANVIARVLPPSGEEAKQIPDGSMVVSLGNPSNYLDAIKELNGRKVSVFTLDLLPRISRAQSMDALSSQAGVAGYRAVLLAANEMSKFFPMLMTAAGTIPPAKVLVMGAGVAGLQAIATAKRLGAQVFAYDVRPAVKEEVQSLGAKFVELKLEAAEGSGGYAGEQSDEFQQKQRELISNTVAQSDVVITTAAIPGRRAPILVTKEMVDQMKPGSVIIDIAAATGGNCELTKDGETVVEKGIKIIGASQLPSSMAAHASQLYSRNIVAFLTPMIEEGKLKFDFDDEVVAGTCVCHEGSIRHQPTAEAINSGGAK